MNTRLPPTEIDAKFIATRTPWEVIEPLWWNVSVYDGAVQYERDLQRYSNSQRHLFACMCYIGEVNNGGHDQFYANNVGIVWKDALAGFRVFGEHDVAEILAESAQRMGGHPSLDRGERFETLLRARPDFRDLDERFYRIESSRSLQENLTRSMRSNPSDFMLSTYLGTGRRA